MNAVTQPVLAAFQALREGVATELQWHHLVTAMRVADAVAVARGSKGPRPHIALAQQALDGIKARAMQAGEWRATDLQFAELDAVSDGFDIFCDQVSTMHRPEILKYAFVSTATVLGQLHAAAGEQLALLEG